NPASHTALRDRAANSRTRSSNAGLPRDVSTTWKSSQPREHVPRTQECLMLQGLVRRLGSNPASACSPASEKEFLAWTRSTPQLLFAWPLWFRFPFLAQTFGCYAH